MFSLLIDENIADLRSLLQGWIHAAHNIQKVLFPCIWGGAGFNSQNFLVHSGPANGVPLTVHSHAYKVSEKCHSLRTGPYPQEKASIGT